MNAFPVGSWDASRPLGQGDAARAAALVAARLPPPLAALAEAAYDLAWSWHGGEQVFRRVDPRKWIQVNGNPVRLLMETAVPRLERLARDASFVSEVDALRGRLDRHRAAPWREGPSFSSRRPVVFLCAEFGVHASLPIYSGGLGALAGDFLKEASDARLPFVGVGLYYYQGYFHQRIDASGWQHEYWLRRDAELRPLALVTGPDREPLRVEAEIRGRNVVFHIWRAAVGRTSLYLLDSNLEENLRVDRWISARLYEASPEVRLAQYAALGVAGARALRALGIEPGVVHLNEGHAAFAAFELARHRVEEGATPEEALGFARERTVFTTHTPVPAGNETYPVQDVWRTLGPVPEQLGLEAEGLARLGRIHPEREDEPFGMTVLALRTSRSANGVSRRHGQVAREMWRSLWPGVPAGRVPIGHVTNGVHLPSWMAGPMRALLDRHLGADWIERCTDPELWSAVGGIPDEDLWAARCEQRAALVRWVRDRSVAERLGRSETTDYVEAAARAFDPEVLTLGFARRVAAYKRLNLLARDPLRVAALVSGPRPVQLVIAGKAHPSDEPAKQLIREIFSHKRDGNAGQRVVFLEDYDLASAAHLVSGCDVWVNLPRPPLEASGTSGMKSMLNGGLQLSVLDGWWAEAHDGRNGWGIPAEPFPDEAQRDARDAALLYDLVEKELVPLFYQRDAGGVPRGWVERMKVSLRSLGPRFSAARMLQEYERDVYTPR